MSAAVAGSMVEVEDRREIEAHLIGPRPVLPTRWHDMTSRPYNPGWLFRLLVDVDGKITHAAVESGPKANRSLAMRLAKSLKFKPFERDGQAVPVATYYRVDSAAKDYLGPADRAFPSSNPSPRQLRIALARTGCYGSCPDYWVELRGDGLVTYRGFRDVLVEGEHHWHIAPAAVVALADQFRQADYFRLNGYYEVQATDLPTYVTRLSLGTQEKFVLNYGAGRGADDVVASSSFGEEAPQMPTVVTDLEDAIDAVAGTGPWVRGDAGTLAMLRHARWNFRSPAAGRALGLLLSDCRLGQATEFIWAGVPVNTRGEGSFPTLPVVAALRCSDAGMLRLLAARGALARRQDAVEFLEAAAASGYPEFVGLALQYAPDLKRTTVLFSAAEELEPDERAAGGAAHDPARVIEMLVAAGADPNGRDRNGNTPLHQAQSYVVARALIRAGADPNARGEWGTTPLFNKFFVEPKQAFIEAGADANARSDEGRTALFYQSDANIAKLLIQAGTDVNAKDKAGDTALEAAYSEEVSVLLLANGATPPSDPARLDALRRKAAEKQWTELLENLSEEHGRP